MARVVYNDDSGEGLDLLREHTSVEAADADAERLNALLDRVLRVGQTFVYDASKHDGDELAALNSAYENTPEWKILQSEFPSFFTSAKDVGLCAYWPTIDSEA